MATSPATQFGDAPASTIDADGLPAGERLTLEEASHVIDVATTLRKESSLVDQQLNGDQIREKLRERMVEAATISGDDITNAEIAAAVERYFDILHEFREPPASFERFLASAWVLRKRLAIWAIEILAIVALVALLSALRTP